ncbi:MAG: arylsulfatase [Desulfomonile tiedjei]|nr:arylsulfatase [Desulfomonile tiedjei]
MSTVVRGHFNLAFPLQPSTRRARPCRLYRSALIALTIFVASLVCLSGPALAQQKKPNILVLWGDDIGWYNVSAYNMGVMGYRTPNIDRIAREGALFTDWYGQQSCTAGRAAFITGQSPIRTGLTKVGLPGAELGLKKEDPTIAELLKAQGYATGQFGKNHLGDRDEHLPTAHGFYEFFGNLYHLNAEEEPESVDYPKDPAFKKRFGPRGVIHSWANPDGTQKIEDTGPLTKKRMETVDDEITAAALRFMEQQHKEGKPFFVWWNATRMHIWTHLKNESKDKTGLGIYPDGMVEHDAHVGQLLKKLDELGIADNTIVMYSTDNGAETFSWPDGGTTAFRGEKGTNWEGGYRVPTLIRWPGTIKAGTVYNDVFAHEDMLPTLLTAAGVPDVKEKLLKGYAVGRRTFKAHLDGYDLAPYFKGETKDPPRREFLYWNDDGKLVALRYNRWKLVFSEQRSHGLGVWEQPFVDLRLPAIYDLRADPFERANQESIGYAAWRVERLYLLVPAQAYIANWLASFKEFPPRQKPASFNLDQVMQQIQEGATGFK